MYHILYETTNKVNGKKYIGIHSTNNLNDGYLGSGTAIKRAINKYGESSFNIKILKECSSRKELLLLESTVVNEKIVYDKNYYNMILGGKSRIDALANLDNKNEFLNNQSKAGKLGGKAMMESLTEEELKQWHSAGGKASKNPGGYSMSEEGKSNIKNARKNSQKYLCPICKHKPLDGGNFNKHMNIKHGIEKEECYQWRGSAKVDN